MKLEVNQTGAGDAALVDSKELEGPPQKRPTRDLILEASLELFNREGFDGTSIVMICDHINIMSGNLTYYFPKKRDIVLAIKDKFDARLTELHTKVLGDLLEQHRSTTASDTHHLLRTMLEIIWDHRFFFTSMMSLHRLDRRIFIAFRQVEQQARVGLSQLIQRAINDGTVRPLNYPNSPSAYADNIWYLMWGCMFFQTARDKKLEPAKTVVINNCLLQLGALIEPLVSRELIAEFCNEITSRR